MAIGRLYHRLLAGIACIAWVSLAVQVDVLIGSRGLLPVAEIAGKASFWRLPTVFGLFTPGDGVLVGGAWLGAALAAAAAVGVYPRALIGLSALLYLSYATACRDFLWFQWDSLLLECGALAVFLPRDRSEKWISILFRLLLLKLYFESGMAKWQSYLHDWQDGSAMTYYYETAPLPTPVAWLMHRLPVGWHHFESWATLALELGVPFLAFGPRRVRLVAFVLLTGFQLMNLATANYGFFVLLALALHVFLLDDDAPRLGRPKKLVPAVVISAWAGLSLIGAIGTFGDHGFLPSVRGAVEPFRLVNNYHLFGHITRERIEPQFETTVDGQTWVEHDLRHKAGDLHRAPPIVAPHQPRVDFLLWFYGLSYRRGAPEYVAHLVDRMCHDPEAVQPLFASPLPAHARAVRIVFFQYHFAPSPWWTRAEVDTLGPVGCQ
ncbi:MAG TPA: lipase maturation factor family protein [Haliangiales bacterium]|nr:lipase maturation factor family protein [Haliangiales bacterium]